MRCIFALALVAALPGAASAQQAVQGQVVPIPQSEVPRVEPVDPLAPIVAPATETSPQASVVAPAPPPANAPPPKPRKKGPVDALKPGQFVWVAQDAYEGPMKIVIVLDIQRIYVFQNDKLIGFSTISSGKKGKETPTGVFNILQKNVDHKSNLYSNAPMPYMQRLTWDGIAIHGGHLPGYPASHGCIRLPHPFAKAFFAVTQMSQEVVVLQDTSTPVKRPEPKPVVDPMVTPAQPATDPAVAPAVVPPMPTPTVVFRPQPST
jgi:lipoprotein-anchoring transpeptidase ErfK/SrfK